MNDYEDDAVWSAEIKAVYNQGDTLLGTSVTGSELHFLNEVAQGDGDDDRNGREYTIVGLEVLLYLELTEKSNQTSAPSNNAFRIQ